MIAPSYHQKHYRPALQRFLEPSLCTFFACQLPRLGPLLCQKLAQEVIRLFEALCPPKDYLRPGQALWMASDPHTSPRHPHRSLVPVILTLIHHQDVQCLANGASFSESFSQTLGRIFLEAHAQGGLLSVRHVALLFHRHPADVTRKRQQFEADHHCILPHPGSLQDMGSTVSHKAAAVRKVILEHKDPAAVAREINHAQSSVDRYLRDFHRVQTLYALNHDPDFIHRTTGLAKYVVKQYLQLIQELKPRELKPPKHSI